MNKEQRVVLQGPHMFVARTRERSINDRRGIGLCYRGMGSSFIDAYGEVA